MSTVDDEQAKFALDNMIQATAGLVAIICLYLSRNEPERAQSLLELSKAEDTQFVMQVHGDGIDLFVFDQEKNQIGGPMFSYKKDHAKGAPCIN